MKRFPFPFGTLGITYRTAFLSWMVTVITLLIFVLVIIPLQKRTFVEALESKASAVANSLQEIAGGALLSGDFASAAEACKEKLTTDKGLDFLVIARNDGYSILFDRASWRSEPKSAEVWHPADRKISSEIHIVPFFGRRAFHYSQPFQYIGLPLGWVHVGLPVDSYDQSVATLYRRTGILATACLIFSLLVSALYARRLLHPILAVRQVVQRVAGGDLSARACIERLDELGSLAESVNSMTEALLRRDRIVQSVRFAAQQFLSTGNWSGVVEEVLARIGQAAGTGSVYVFGGVEGKNSPPPRKPLALWSAPEARAAQPACDAVASRLPSHELDRWLEQLAKGETLTTSMVDPDVGQSCIRSIIWSPIFVEDAWWGILGLESCDQTVRAWTDAEQDSIRAAADMLGAAIARQKTQDALIEAKQNLEQRVNDRTKELREQVQAKERARAELAEAQQQLVEVSRRTGMAEVATGVLHNVGNVLNSVNVSVNLLKERLNHSVSQNMEKVAALLAEHRADLPVFLQSNPRGKLLPEYLAKLAILMREERDQLVAETQNLGRSTEHIKEIVAMQQSYARVAGVVEDLPATVLVEDALRIQSESFARHAIKVQRDFKEVPLVRVDKHKVLQILVNLFRNARDAMKASSQPQKILEVQVLRNGTNCVKVLVVDNGIGIDPTNLTRIFQHGFTTKSEGHGFGLHSGALAAREMGGSLHASSPGLGRGATFTLELPVAEKDRN